jgi:CBS domain-containing protein
MLCPDCGHDNIEGLDDCEQCGQSLIGSQRIAIPSSDFERLVAMQAIGSLLPKPPVAMPETATTREAVTAMIDGGFGCIVIETDGKLAGIFTERDVLNKVHGDPSRLDRPVAEFMTAKPETVETDDTIGYTLQAMDSGGYRHMPVVDADGNTTGIVSVRDILRYVHQRSDELKSKA